ncbi:MAG TPA: RcnB family protein [Caulobacteraceae bacterium]|nr:RcnB family protein [Caulobacteraceae bacterium]
MAAAVCAALAMGLTAGPALAQHGGGHGRGGGGGQHGGGPGWGGGRGGGPGWGRGGGPPPAWQGGPRGPRGPGWAPGGRPGNPAWDQRRFNGYWVGGRWYYGRPQSPAYQSPGFRPGFTPWRRGSFLPPAYQTYNLDQYWRFHLRRPPYGYHWVQVGGEFLLVSQSTGLIFDVVTSG